MAASPHDVESDALLVVAAQDGDSDAFAELFRRHYPMVRRVCARKLRDLREADEVAQAAFVRAYERLDKCNGERRFGAWVQVIANNLCIDHMRAAARTTPVDEPVSEDEPIAIGPEDAVLNAEQAAMIQRALATLPDRQRDVVVARDVDGRRPPEVCRIQRRDIRPAHCGCGYPAGARGARTQSAQHQRHHPAGQAYRGHGAFGLGQVVAGLRHHLR